uniref:DEAD/DEAH-box helicase domain-containing protein n=1 Tax=Amphimedon queenslandica TaxID=400682 RepID=A0A1X7UQT7_AMPQE
MNAITSTVKGKDSFIVQPTGTGKSMCYAIPPLLTGKLAIVISPTISLMCDQVHKMEKHGVFATFLGFAQ